jgi:hypothetical protein
LVVTIILITNKKKLGGTLSEYTISTYFIILIYLLINFVLLKAALVQFSPFSYS